MLVSRWFVTNRARAMAMAYCPVFMFAAPLIMAEVTADYGFKIVCYCLSVTYLFLAPLLLLIVERPQHQPSPNTEGNHQDITDTDDDLHVIKRLDFWMLSLAIGIMAGSGVTFIVHAYALGLDRGMTVLDASMLVAIFSASGIGGLFLFGMLAEKSSAVVALFVNALCQVIAWTGLALLPDPRALLAMAALTGGGLMAVMPLHGTALLELFGNRDVSKTVGLSYSFKLPFTLSMAPLAGYFFDLSHSYTMAFLIQVVLLLCATGMLLQVLRASRRYREPPFIPTNKREMVHLGEYQ
jgi:cyanate permease